MILKELRRKPGTWNAMKPSGIDTSRFELIRQLSLATTTTATAHSSALSKKTAWNQEFKETKWGEFLERSPIAENIETLQKGSRD